MAGSSQLIFEGSFVCPVASVVWNLNDIGLALAAKLAWSSFKISLGIDELSEAVVVMPPSVGWFQSFLSVVVASGGDGFKQVVCWLMGLGEIGGSNMWVSC